MDVAYRKAPTTELAEEMSDAMQLGREGSEIFASQVRWSHTLVHWQWPNLWVTGSGQTTATSTESLMPHHQGVTK